MKILVLCSNYPGPNEKAALTYVKARNHAYREKGVDDITVLNFSLSKGSYIEDGFNVISLEEYKCSYKDSGFDILISHAPNIRNHYLFLKKFESKFKKLVFFFHGHEVLDMIKEYPMPYSYLGNRRIERIISRVYDPLKFYLWRNYFKKKGNNVTLIFVSKWIENKFQEYLDLSLESLKVNHYIIHNNISRRFETEMYKIGAEKKYDFITIRSNLDDPKYAVDVVNNLAKANPEYRFLVVGRGEFFRYFEKASNIEQIEKYLTPDEIVELLNQSKCALMPTKNDTQGILACEMATFGIPTITSDIDVCKIVFENFPNVAFISNEETDINLGKLLSELKPATHKQEKYFYNNTILKEINLIKEL